MATTVEFPAMRWEVMCALASLADRTYQERAWLHHRFDAPGQFDSFDLVVHALYDDTDVLADPRSCLSTILLPGPEIELLGSLGRLLGPLIDRLGDVEDARFMESDEWPKICHLAGVTLAAMVRRGGI